jgi:hypothetical protein
MCFVLCQPRTKYLLIQTIIYALYLRQPSAAPRARHRNNKILCVCVFIAGAPCELNRVRDLCRRRRIYRLRPPAGNE